MPSCNSAPAQTASQACQAAIPGPFRGPRPVRGRTGRRRLRWRSLALRPGTPTCPGQWTAGPTGAFIKLHKPRDRRAEVRRAAAPGPLRAGRRQVGLWRAGGRASMIPGESWTRAAVPVGAGPGSGGSAEAVAQETRPRHPPRRRGVARFRGSGGGERLRRAGHLPCGAVASSRPSAPTLTASY